MSKAAIILAAGAGTRMKSRLAKVLHKVAGLPLLGHVVYALKEADIERIVVVTSPLGQEVRDYAKSLGCDFAVQHEQLGTGHAVAAAKQALGDYSGTLLIINGDMPLMDGRTICLCLQAQATNKLALLAFEAHHPGAYGRVLRDREGYLDRIVEYKDASEWERSVKLCNAGCYAAESSQFFRWTSALRNDNAQKEYYLTDVPALAKSEGVRCAIALAEEVSATGVNDRMELAQAERKFQERKRARLMADGVSMSAPETVFFSHDTHVENDVEIEPFVVFGGGVVVKSGARIRSHSHIEGAFIDEGAVVGPFARLRPGTKIGEGAHIGNFVEVKNTRVEKGAKANHLTYLGDAKVGASANIGAGTITCNYDGFTKSVTEIGAGAFIGSDTALVAPVKIGAGAITAAGSVITEDVAPDALAIARAVLAQKPGWAKTFRARKKSDED